MKAIKNLKLPDLIISARIQATFIPFNSNNNIDENPFKSFFRSSLQINKNWNNDNRVLRTQIESCRSEARYVELLSVNP